ncbi:hypothetical protein BU17DRAFT_63032 [Hysterangium stoloniferum]|nr:hypothetical protein BU17DRAFT_63032 [Hysterangium stoloniferum]
MDLTQFQLLQSEAVVAVQGLTATRYLSAGVLAVVGLVVLLYDHLLLFGDEVLPSYYFSQIKKMAIKSPKNTQVRIIWKTDLSWSKFVFMFNRYTVPFYLGVAAFALSGLSSNLSTPFCRNWVTASTFLGVTSLGIANTFVVHRVYALWGCSRRILIWSSVVLVVIYTFTYVATGFAIIEARPHISYSPTLRSCIIDSRPRLYILAFAIPLLFEIFIFVLTCWNAFDRPRNMQTVLIKQLYLDGVVFFLALTSGVPSPFVTQLQLTHIFLQLSEYLTSSYSRLRQSHMSYWESSLINRMVITISVDVEETYDTETLLYGKNVPPPPFDLGTVIARGAGRAGRADARSYDFGDMASFKSGSRTRTPDVEYGDGDSSKPFARTESGTS